MARARVDLHKCASTISQHILTKTTMSARERSASPAHEPRAKKHKTGGFKWKEQKPRDADKDSAVLERGYRDRSPRRDRNRDREQGGSTRNAEPEGESAKDRALPRTEEGNADVPTQTSNDAPADNTSGQPIEGRRDPFAGYVPRASKPPPAPADKPITTPTTTTKPKKPKTPKPPRPPAPTGPMIIVHINDRLGTKAAIPCLASDSVKAFKAIVAAHIGRQPHEILLKRQGERPFKDQLTLEDYGVSSGVQLDLELDTGD
ncbi:hypothetical protein LTR53_005777 [Teratosphaeriaceae sp. CCFEE 6253]|nr:hypothetical protein LTR53_005777 [Teratosphaeriaceae sp. CCFEE 6253]